MVLKYIKKDLVQIKKSIINNSNKIINAIKLFKSMIDSNEFVIPGEYNAKPNNNIDLDWMMGMKRQLKKRMHII